MKYFEIDDELWRCSNSYKWITTSSKGYVYIHTIKPDRGLKDWSTTNSKYLGKFKIPMYWSKTLRRI